MFFNREIQDFGFVVLGSGRGRLGVFTPFVRYSGLGTANSLYDVRRRREVPVDNNKIIIAIIENQPFYYYDYY